MRLAVVFSPFLICRVRATSNATAPTTITPRTFSAGPVLGIVPVTGFVVLEVVAYEGTEVALATGAELATGFAVGAGVDSVVLGTNVKTGRVCVVTTFEVVLRFFTPFTTRRTKKTARTTTISQSRMEVNEDFRVEVLVGIWDMC
jgi:hypothetical protein